MQKVARAVGQPDTIEYWKSAPYLVNFMNNYKLKRELKRAQQDPERRVTITPMLQRISRLPIREMNSYGDVDPGNARLRGLITDMIERGAWKLPWIPPSLPYYLGSQSRSENGLQSTTKRLIFSGDTSAQDFGACSPSTTCWRCPFRRSIRS
jgi:hypothetical protein